MDRVLIEQGKRQGMLPVNWAEPLSQAKKLCKLKTRDFMKEKHPKDHAVGTCATSQMPH